MTMAESTRVEAGRVGFALDRRFVDGLFGEIDDPLCAAAARGAGLIGDFDFAPDDRLRTVEVLVTGWGCPPLDDGVLARMPALRAVVHAAGSVKGVVTEACWRSGIEVSSQADANAVPVAEFALAAIIFANKRAFALHAMYDEVRNGWSSAALPSDIGNYRRVVGVVGASRVGRRLIELLRPFDLSVLVADPFLDESGAERLGAELVDLDTLCRRSDVVTLHAPSLPSTRHMIDAARLALMRDGATLINTARGALVDHEALAAETRAGRLAAVLDHTDPTVLAADSPLFDNAGVWITPHIAGSLGNELSRVGQGAIDEVRRFLAGDGFAHPIHEADLARTA